MAVTDCDSSLSWNHTMLVGVAASQVTQVTNTVGVAASQVTQHCGWISCSVDKTHGKLTIPRDGGMESTNFLHQLGLEPEYEIPLSH